MSTNPGIGRKWIEKYYTDVYPGDFVLLNGKKLKVPRYYDKIYSLIDPEGLAKVKQVREERALTFKDCVDNTAERLCVREQVQLAHAQKLVRGYDVRS